MGSTRHVKSFWKFLRKVSGGGSLHYLWENNKGESPRDGNIVRQGGVSNQICQSDPHPGQDKALGQGWALEYHKECSWGAGFEARPGVEVIIHCFYFFDK